VSLACRHDYLRFAQQELANRERCQMPPYYRLARIVLGDRKADKARAAGEELRKHIEQWRERSSFSLEVRGPVPAVIARLDNYHRQEILVKSKLAAAIQDMLSALRRGPLSDLGVQTVVDVDPINLL